MSKATIAAKMEPGSTPAILRVKIGNITSLHAM